MSRDVLRKYDFLSKQFQMLFEVEQNSQSVPPACLKIDSQSRFSIREFFLKWENGGNQLSMNSIWNKLNQP